MSASDSGYSSGAVAGPSAMMAAEIETATATLPLSSQGHSSTLLGSCLAKQVNHSVRVYTASKKSKSLSQQDSSSQFSLEGMREALQRRRRTLVDCGGGRDGSSQLQSSTESVIEFTAPPSSASFLFPAESEVIELLKMAFILQVGKLKITILRRLPYFEDQ